MKTFIKDIKDLITAMGMLALFVFGFIAFVACLFNPILGFFMVLAGFILVGMKC